MTQRDTPQAINDRATEWVARIDAGPLDAAAQAELDAWVASDDRHRGAFFRATVAWSMLDRASALANREQTQPVVAADPAPEDYHRPVARRGLLWGGGAIAASFVAAALGWRMLAPRPLRIQTAAGEIRHVPLGDGSHAALNSATLLDVDMTTTSRKIQLEAGEAWFEVAKDASRPFLVSTGEIRVRAVGTAFSVHRLAAGADVQVTEGKVEIWVVGREPQRVIVGAGARMLVSTLDGPRPAVADAAGIDRSLAWRDGALEFQGETLSAAAGQFNRYNRTKLVVDPLLADEPVVGRFRIHEPGAFAQAASTMFDARVQTGPDTIRIARH